MTTMDQLENLNEFQKKAVLHKEGPLLIIAGAGAGKTKTLTQRILHLIKEGVDPINILAITFTNKAAREMSDRVEEGLTEKNIPGLGYNEKPFVSTFHSLGVRVIKENSKLLNVPRHFTILDQSDSLSFIKQAIKENDLDPKQFTPRAIANVISRQKGDMVSVEKYAAKAGNQYFPQIVSGVWQKYEKKLKEHKSLDFDDLLLKTTILIEKDEKVRKYYQNLWKYIHIDEYQDTNTVQYRLSKALAQDHQNICVVGDGDQNIYSWRGANMKNIMNFEKDYPKAKVILLEENYRSTQNILQVANDIIKKNTVRVDKNLFTKNQEGEKISLFEAYDETDEARFVANKAKELIKEGLSPKKIAVLYRANFQSRALEEAFLQEEVPYQVLGVRFFERKEIKDVLSFIKAALNPDSLADIKRIINVPPRGIGKVTLLKMFSGKEETLSPAMKERVTDFRKMLMDTAEIAKNKKTSELIKFVMTHSGIEDMLKKGGDEEKERLENLGELVTLATKYDILSPEEGVEKLLTDASLASDQDSLTKNEDAVKLMTVHASKGLEFPYVFVTGLEDDLFPHKKMGEANVSREAEEEERRLFYVAVTRAEEKLFLSYASFRTIFGSKQVNAPSEFIIDINEELIENEGREDTFDSDEAISLPEVEKGDIIKTIYLD